MQDTVHKINKACPQQVSENSELQNGECKAIPSSNAPVSFNPSWFLFFFSLCKQYAKSKYWQASKVIVEGCPAFRAYS